MGDGGVFLTPCADFSRPVEELEYTCLLKSIFGVGLRRMSHGPQHFEKQQLARKGLSLRVQNHNQHQKNIPTSEVHQIVFVVD